MYILDNDIKFESTILPLTDKVVLLKSNHPSYSYKQILIHSDSVGMKFLAPFHILNKSLIPLSLYETKKADGKLNRFSNPVTVPNNTSTYLPIIPTMLNREDNLLDKFHADFEHMSFRTRQPIRLHITNKTGCIEMYKENHDKCSSYEYSIQLTYQTCFSPDELFGRFISIYPRWIIINQTSFDLHIGQDLGNTCYYCFKICTHKYEPIVHALMKSNESIRLSLGLTPHLIPGSGFSIDKISNTNTVTSDQFDLQYESYEDRKLYPLSIRILPTEHYTKIFIEQPKYSPYAIFNFLSQSILYHQKKFIPPRIIKPNCYSDMLINSAVENPAISIIIDKVEYNIPVHTLSETYSKLTDHIYYRVIHGTHNQVFFQVMDDQFLFQFKKYSKYQLPPPPALSLSFYITQLDISVVHQYSEVVAIAIRKMNLTLLRDVGHSIESIKVNMNNIQIDNQSAIHSKYPVFLQTFKLSKQYAFSLFIKRKLTSVQDTIYFYEIRCNVTPLLIKLDDALLGSLLMLQKELNQQVFANNLSIEDYLNVNGMHLRDVEFFLEQIKQDTLQVNDISNHRDYMSYQINIEQMIVNPVILRFWFIRQRGNETGVKQLNMGGFLNLLITSCDDVRVAVPGLTMKNAFNMCLETFLASQREFYIMSLKNQVSAIVLQYMESAFLIGTPIKLFNMIDSGRVHMFSDTIDGIMDSPEAFAKGVAQGSVALVENFIGGTFSTVGSIASIGSRISNLTVSRGETRLNRRDGLLNGITRGISGVITDPLKGGIESGTTGAIKGVGKGLVGMVTKPLGGFFGSVARIANHVADSIDSEHIPSNPRARYPRILSIGRVIAPLNTIFEVFEIQRLFESNWSNYLLPTDGPNWYTGDYEKIKEINAIVQEIKNNDPNTPNNYWCIDTSNAAIDGFQYGREYYGTFTANLSTRSKLRRRRWVKLNKMYTTSLIQLENMQSSLLKLPALSTFTLPNKMESNYADVFRLILSKTPVVSLYMVETWENNRYYPVVGWSTQMLPNERSTWSTYTGESYASIAKIALGDNYKWVGHWKRIGGGKEGWSYSEDFDMKFNKKMQTHGVRRRCWRRWYTKNS